MGAGGSAALIADDDEYFRLALRVILIAQPQVSEVFESASLDDAIESMSVNEAVSFAFFDLNMPGLDTFSGIRATREAFPNVRVAVVSASRNRNDVLRALDAGAHGFLPKGEGVKQLEAGIKIVCNGSVYVPEFLADSQGRENGFADSDFEVVASQSSCIDNLTSRQQEVLAHVVKGKSNKEIARAISVSESTVKFHVASLCLRLNVKNRTQIAARASRFNAS